MAAMLINANYFYSDTIPAVGGNIHSSKDTILYYSYFPVTGRFVPEFVSLSLVIQI